MFKKMLMVLMVCFSFRVDAMKHNNVQIPTKESCLFLWLPLDIQDLIGQYLMSDYEKEEEFIKRTMQEDYMVQMFRLDDMLFYNCTMHCPDKTKMATITFNQELKQDLNIIIVDTVEKEEITVPYGKDYPLCFALSQKSAFCAATINRKYNSIPKDWDKYVTDVTFIRNGSKNYFFNILEIANLTTNHSREFVISFDQLTSVAFNKQGTHLIVHGEKQRPSAKTYQIFPLKVAVKDAPKNDIDKGLLQYYFMEKFVCKTITNG